MLQSKSSSPNVILCDYEKTRMENLQFTAAKMKALGFDSLANKELLNKYDRVANGSVMENQNEVSKNVLSSKSKKEKQPSQAQERQQKNRKSSQDKQSIISPDLDLVSSGMPSQARVQSLTHQLETQPKEVVICQQEKIQQYLPPGCMSRYVNMRKYKGPRRQEHIGSPSLVEEQHRPPETANVSGLNEIDVVEDDALNQIQVESALNDTIQNEPNEKSVTKEKKHRGRTILAHVHARSMDKRPPVIFNGLGQSVGPTKEVVADFSHLLGTLAKDSAFAPLNYETWKHMPLKEKIWEYVQKKFILDEDAKKYVLKNVNEKWRLYKARIKEKFYNEDESMEERMAKRPENIPEDEFEDLMLYWDSEKAKEISKINKENR